MKYLILGFFTVATTFSTQAQTSNSDQHEIVRQVGIYGIAITALPISILTIESIHRYQDAATLKKAQVVNLLNLAKAPRAITEEQIAQIKESVFDGNAVEVRFVPSKNFLQQEQWVQKISRVRRYPRDHLLDAGDLKTIRSGIINTTNATTLEETLKLLQDENVKIVSIEKMPAWAQEQIWNLKGEGQFRGMGAGALTAIDLVLMATVLWESR